MSTKYYIKDENGAYLSTDGKFRYTMLEGRELYNFLKSKDGKHRRFYIEIDDNGDKIGIEADPEQIKKHSKQQERERYNNKVKAKLNITIISANAPVLLPSGEEIEMIDTVANEEADVEADAIHRSEIETLRAALKTLTEDEYNLIHRLFLDDCPISQHKYAKEIGMTQKGISKQKERIFLKLKKFF